MTGESAVHEFGTDYYRRLRRRIIGSMVLGLCLSLLVVGGTIFYYYNTYVRATITANLKSIAEKRSEAIDVFLSERVSNLKACSRLALRDLAHPQSRLSQLFEVLRSLNQIYVDIGMIRADGRQFAYVGPYDLLGKNYRDSRWFQEVLLRKTYVSDVFLGYRNVPHIAIAILEEEDGAPWILRVTIDTETIRRLLQSARLGADRDAYILNMAGEIQIHAGKRERIASETVSVPAPGTVKVAEARTVSGVKLLTAASRLNDGRWTLVVAEDPESEFVSLYNARKAALVLCIFLAGLMGVLSVYVSRWIVGRIEAADKQKDMVHQQVVQTGKLIALGKMAAGLAHEINNPLAIISESAGYAKELLDMACSQEAGCPAETRAEVQTALADIIEQSFRGKDITQRLLGFARRMEPKSTDVDLNHLLSDLLKYYARILAKGGKIKLVEKFDHRPCVVHTDPDQLQQVIINIIDNAIYFTSIRGGTITVGTKNVDGAVHVSVSDTGPGMKGSVKRKIFDPFFTTKPVGKGSGLGLAICFGIVKKLGGEIQVDSVEGWGTTFTIILPRGGDERRPSDDATDPDRG